MIQYYLDNTEIKSGYGVCVSKSKNLIGRPQIKDPRSVEYAEMNGKFVDIEKPKYQERKITLECFMPSDSKGQMIEYANIFFKALNAAGMHRLEVAIDDKKKMFFDVYNGGDSHIEPEWHSDKSCGTFTLTLVEPLPLKMVYLFGTDAGIDITTEKYIRVSWGDGSFDEIYNPETLSHPYESEDNYAIISGEVDECTIVGGNGELIYSEI